MSIATPAASLPKTVVEVRSLYQGCLRRKNFPMAPKPKAALEGTLRGSRGVRCGSEHLIRGTLVANSTNPIGALLARTIPGVPMWTSCIHELRTLGEGRAGLGTAAQTACSIARLPGRPSGQWIGESPITLNPRASMFETPVSIVTAEPRTRGRQTEWNAWLGTAV